MRYNIIIILTFILLINSCKNGSEIDTDLNVIEIDELPVDNFDFFNIVEDYKFIKLETIDEGLIGNIHKIIFTANRIFILDIAKGIYSFDLKGNFLNKYGNMGRGPGEWLYPQEIAFDEKTQRLIVYCRTNKKLLSYSSQGSLINEIHLGLTFRSMEYSNEDTIIIFSRAIYNSLQDYGELTYDLIAINSSVEILHTQFANNTEPNIGKTVMTHNKYFCKTESDIFLHWPFNDTIYIIKNKSLNAIPFLYVNFGKKRINNRMLTSNSELELFDRIVEDKNRTIIRPVHVAGNLMLIEFAAGIDYDNPDDNYRLIYNIKTGEELMFKDLIYCENYKWKNPIGVTNDFFVNILYPSEVDCYNNNFLEGISYVADSEYENPIILLYSFKDIEDWN